MYLGSREDGAIDSVVPRPERRLLYGAREKGEGRERTCTEREREGDRRERREER